jgi:hypothetical protein
VHLPPYPFYLETKYRFVHAGTHTSARGPRVVVTVQDRYYQLEAIRASEEGFASKTAI